MGACLEVVEHKEHKRVLINGVVGNVGGFSRARELSGVANKAAHATMSADNGRARSTVRLSPRSESRVVALSDSWYRFFFFESDRIK